MFGKKKEDAKVLGGVLVEGLPIPENSNVVLKLTPDHLIIKTTKGQEFEINISKLDMIDYKSETEMKNIITQSAPGMIIGAAAFGLLGAMVGGRVKTKEKKVVSHFLIFNYQSGELKTIVIQTNDGNSAIQMVEFFGRIKPETIVQGRMVL